MPKLKAYKNAPTEITQLLKKFKGNRSKAGRAIGFRDSGIINLLGHRKREMTDDIKARIASALKGEAVGPVEEEVRKKKRHGVALMIVTAKAALFERIYNFGETFDGSWKFKRAVGKDWVGIIAMSEENADDFAPIARRRGAFVDPVTL